MELNAFEVHLSLLLVQLTEFVLLCTPRCDNTHNLVNPKQYELSYKYSLNSIVLRLLCLHLVCRNSVVHPHSDSLLSFMSTLCNLYFEMSH